MQPASNISLLEAQQLVRAGRIAEAETLYRRILDNHPLNVEALNALGLMALAANRHAEALALLQQACEVNPKDALTCYHLGKAHEACGNAETAIGMYRQAVDEQPDFYVARLHLASLLERHDTGQALIQFARALRTAQSQNRWTNPSTTPVPLQPLVEHAARIVQHSRRALLFDLLQPLKQKYGADVLQRIEQCIRIYLGEDPTQPSDPKQRPTFLYIPGLPSSPYLPRSQFPWADALEQQTEAIRSELQRLLPEPTGRERVFTSDKLENENLRSQTTAPSWNGYYFYRYGEKRTDNWTTCPNTAAALQLLPLMHIREHAPEVLFSVFTADTHLLPHTGVTNARVVCHLPLIIPEDCALQVGNEVHVWQEGKIVVFDDTFLHEAWNRSRSTRVVLIADMWNPFLSEEERMAFTSLVEKIGDFRKSIENA